MDDGLTFFCLSSSSRPKPSMNRSATGIGSVIRPCHGISYGGCRVSRFGMYILMHMFFAVPVDAQGRYWLVNKPQMTVTQFLTDPTIWSIISGGICLGVLYCMRMYWRILCPRGLELLRDLELDDTPDRRFDGIDNALYDRLRDPWNYRPIPYVPIEREEIKTPEQIKQEETAAAIREAAQKLRSNASKATKVKTDTDEEWGVNSNRPSSASATSAAEGTSSALATSSAFRRNTRSITAAEKRSEELAAQLAEHSAPKNKWEMWNQIADGKHSGVVGDAGISAVASARSDASNRSNHSTPAAPSSNRGAAELVSLTGTKRTPEVVDARFSGRAAKSERIDSMLPSAGSAVGQWSSRGGDSRPSLQLDLSSIKIAPANIQPPPRPQLMETLKFNDTDSEDGEYHIVPLSTQFTGYNGPATNTSSERNTEVGGSLLRGPVPGALPRPLFDPSSSSSSSTATRPARPPPPRPPPGVRPPGLAILPPGLGRPPPRGPLGVGGARPPPRLPPPRVDLSSVPVLQYPPGVQPPSEEHKKS